MKQEQTNDEEVCGKPKEHFDSGWFFIGLILGLFVAFIVGMTVHEDMKNAIYKDVHYQLEVTGGTFTFDCMERVK